MNRYPYGAEWYARAEHLERYGYPRSVSYDVAGIAMPLPSGAAIARSIAKLSQVREPQYRCNYPLMPKNHELKLSNLSLP